MMHENIFKICQQADSAFKIYKKINRKMRYDFLQRIAKNLLSSKNDIVTQAHLETYISIDDLSNEFDRTIYQIYDYSNVLLQENFLNISDKTSLYSNKLSLYTEAIGNVVIFGASNFPLAYSTVGGDVISAFVAGCSVIFKPHEAHLKTSLLVSDIIKKTIIQSNIPEFIYQHLDDISYEQLAILIQQHYIKAVGFTGSLSVGRYLFDICQNRPEPIPFFGELGSINPVFICDNFFEKNTSEIAKDYSESFTKRMGQVCVNPAILIIPKQPNIQNFYQQVNRHIQSILPQIMLTENIFMKFNNGYKYLRKYYNQITDNNPIHDDDSISPVLFSIKPKEWLDDKKLYDEIFGAIGIIIEYETAEEMYQISESFSGQLTASIFGTCVDKNTINNLYDILVTKVGRLVFNDYPTSVKVDYNMHHGGVYPASTSPQFTAVGKRAISRFMRPVCNENKPLFLYDYKDRHDFFISKTNDEQSERLADFIAKKLNDCVLKNGYATLAVSGGKSPIPLFKELSRKNLKWDNIALFLVDERLVETNSEHSNENLVRKYLLVNNAQKARFVGLYENQPSEALLEYLNYSSWIPEKFDCVILGMGDDGHFASLFPQSDNLQIGLHDTETKYSLQFSPSEPKERISMNLSFIIQSDNICLSISGDKKLNILHEALYYNHHTYPIEYLLEKTKINIFYVE